MKGKFQQLQTSRDLIFELNLNKHPKDCKNLSLVDARNIQLSNDHNVIQNIIIEEKGDLYYKLYDIYGGNEDDNILNCIIIGTVNCIKELVLFIRTLNNNLHIYRYKDNILSKQLITNYEDYFLDKESNFHIQEFAATYTYNRNDELIVAYCFSPTEESNSSKQYPLSIINLGKWIDNNIDTTGLNMNVKSFPINPVYPLTNINNVNFIKGNSKKGWYNFYIRYKIDRDNYTKWQSVGNGTYLDEFKDKIIYENKNSEDEDASFIFDTISNEYDICNISVELDLEVSGGLKFGYNKYQIALTCDTKIYNECKKSEDIDIKDSNNIFTLDYKTLKDYDINQLVKNFNNYYNVKNIINYKNQLYISNYEEYNFNLTNLDITSNLNEDGEIIEENDSNIQLKLIKENLTNEIDYTRGTVKIFINDYYEHNYDENTTIDKFLENYVNNPISSVYSYSRTINSDTKPVLQDQNYYLVNYYDLDKLKRIIRLCDLIEYENISSNGNDYEIKEYTYLGLPENIYIEVDENNVKFNGHSDLLLFQKINNITEYHKDFIKRYSDGSGGIYNIYGLFNTIGINEDGEEVLPTISRDIIIKNNTNDIKWCVVPNEYYYFYIHLINEYGEISNGKYIGKFLSLNDYNILQNLQIKVKYINYNYFISLEKINSRVKYSGLINKNKEFYSEDLNYKDNIDLNINKILYENIEINDKYKLSIPNRYDLKGDKSNSYFINNVFVKNNKNIKNIAIDDYLIAGSIEDNNKSQNTKLVHDISQDFSLAYLYNENLNSKYEGIPQLIRCSDYIKITSDDYNRLFIKGHLGYGTAIIFDKEYRINHENKVVDKDNNVLETTPMVLYRYLTFTFDFPESKQINNNPQRYITLINEVDFDNPEAKFYNSKLYLVQDSVDLFKNNSIKYQDSVINTYISEENIKNYKTKYNKTIRRSNYISDESLLIGWRNFEIENYKSIIENKGDIVNLIDFGNILLIHTEHSLFQINLDETIIANNRNIQLSSVDVFNIDYKEIFTDKKGIGGLSKKSNAIGGKFGYIYYSKEDNRFYRYDNNRLSTIDDNIILFLNWTDDDFKNDYSKYLTISYDKKRNIISFNDIFRTSFIYNLNTSSFISLRETFKNLIYNNTFEYKDLLYNYSISNSKTTLSNNGVDLYYDINEDNKHKYSIFSIIINENYNKIKILEYITYKLYKITLKNRGVLNREPYSGYSLRVYNDICDTGFIDIQKDLKQENSYNEIIKPTFNLGNFNISYLRDKTTNSQIFGNYFIIEFSFPENSNIKFEFESLDYAISEKII